MFHRVLVMESWCALFGIAHFWLMFFVAGFQRFFIHVRNNNITYSTMHHMHPNYCNLL